MQIGIRQMGTLAARTLQSSGTVQVASVFETSFLVMGAAGFVAVGTPDMDIGPLNAIAGDRPAETWEACGVRTGQTGRLDGTGMAFDGGPTFDFGTAAVWTQPDWPPWTSSGRVQAAISALNAQALPRLPRDGLAGFIMTSQAGGWHIGAAMVRAAMLAIATLEDWLVAALAEPDDGHDMLAAAGTATRRLMGLGPGLTPSGDDVLAGLALALHGSGETGCASHLAALIAAAPQDATSAYSRALLTAAADGHASRSMHRSIADLIEGRVAAIDNVLARVDAVGETSGWDMLAGALIGLSAVAGARA